MDVWNYPKQIVPAAEAGSTPVWRAFEYLSYHIFVDGSILFQQHVMNFLQSAGRLYALDTIDSRFTSSKTSLSHVDPPRPSSYEGRQKSDGASLGPSPSRWRTPEFMVYGLVFLFAVPSMFKSVYDVSQSRSVRITHLKRMLNFHIQHRIPIMLNLKVYFLKAGYQAER